MNTLLGRLFFPLVRFSPAPKTKPQIKIRNKFNKRFWTTKEDIVLRNVYKTSTAKEIGLPLHRSPEAVVQRAYTLNIKKNKT